MFALWISRRLKLNASGSKANSTGMIIAVAGVALALIVMAATLAVVRGFKNQITERLMGFEPDISVLPAYDYETAVSAPFIYPTPALADAIADVVPDAEWHLRFTLPGMLKTDNDYAGIYFQAFSSPEGYELARRNMKTGLMPDFAHGGGKDSIVVSASVASALSLAEGDKIMAYFFEDNNIKTRRFTISGIYSTGFAEYDDVVAYAPLRTLQRVASADSLAATQIAVGLPNDKEIESAAAALQERMIHDYQSGLMSEIHPVDNARHTGAVYFNWLSLLDTNVIVIFILMACVAGFTLVSSMFILVLDRIPTIGLLRALGASRGQIRAIFSAMAMKTVLLGLLIGNAIAIPLLLAQGRWHVLRLNPELYYLPAVPVEINWWWMLFLNLAFIAGAWLLLLLPAQSAAATPPAQITKYSD